MNRNGVYRERVAAPPFGRLAAIVISGYDGEQVRDIARQLGKAAPAVPRMCKVWGPTPAFYALLRGQTRERLLVQAAKGVDVQAYLTCLAGACENPHRRARHGGCRPDQFFLGSLHSVKSAAILAIKTRWR